VAVPGPTPKNPIGPTGRRAAETVAALRKRDRLSYRELSDKLKKLGRPIPTLGLSRVERGERRIDADDLVALAIAIGTTPNRLLLPGTAQQRVDVALTPGVEISEQLAWAWAQGKAPIEACQGVVPTERVHQFLNRSLPDHPGYQLPEIAPHLDAITEVTSLIKRLAEERGIPTMTLLAMVQTVIFAQSVAPASDVAKVTS
jgi:transcriptional regulator with XRE-family HTH domain